MGTKKVRRTNEPVEIDDRVAGTVNWFNDSKGYGFIKMPGYQDVFVHYSDIIMDGRKTLLQGDKVTFSVEASSHNGKCKAVRVIVS